MDSRFRMFSASANATNFRAEFDKQFSSSDYSELKPLISKLSDIYVMLKSIEPAMKSSLTILQQMRALLLKKINTNLSPQELSHVISQFNTLQQALVSTQYFKNFKNILLTKGNINIYIDIKNTRHKCLTIELDPFHETAQKISHADIRNDAHETFYLVKAAIRQIKLNLPNCIRVEECAYALTHIPPNLRATRKKINDMLDVTNYVCAQDTKQVEVEACQKYFRIYIDWLQRALTLPTLNSRIYLGSGEMTLQIGEEITTDNCLSLHLPITDPVQLGLDKVDISKKDDAMKARAILANVKNDLFEAMQDAKNLPVKSHVKRTRHAL